MSKRGLSREEKKTRMLQIFHETSDFYTLKDLEKIAPKSKGIVLQSVKEILDELVSEGLVSFDKIGTSNYFWSFPSSQGAAKQATLDKIMAETGSLEKKLVETQAAIAAAQVDREDTDERTALLAKLDEVRSEAAALATSLEQAGAANPAKYERKARAVQVAKQAAERWTDNTMTLLSFCKNQFNLSDSEIREAIGISEDWEDIDFS